LAVGWARVSIGFVLPRRDGYRRQVIRAICTTISHEGIEAETLDPLGVFGVSMDAAIFEN
jgi:hypothetical protein